MQWNPSTKKAEGGEFTTNLTYTGRDLKPNQNANSNIKTSNNEECIGLTENA